MRNIKKIIHNIGNNYKPKEKGIVELSPYPQD